MSLQPTQARAKDKVDPAKPRTSNESNGEQEQEVKKPDNIYSGATLEEGQQSDSALETYANRSQSRTKVLIQEERSVCYLATTRVPTFNMKENMGKLEDLPPYPGPPPTYPLPPVPK